MMNNKIRVLPKPPKKKLGFPWTEETSPSVYDPIIQYPKITIITPSFNQGQYIEETIRSVLLQNYPNLEYIIIDGGSDDNTLEIINKYEKWIDYWVSEPDNGQAHAINKGLKYATGKVFNWLNSDDTLRENALFEVGRAFLDDKLHVAAFREYHIVGEEIIRKTKGTTIAKSLEATLAQFHIDQPSTFFRLNRLKKIGRLQESLHYLFDAEMWIRYLLINGLDGCQKFNYYSTNFRLHEHSKTVASQELFQNEIHTLLLALLNFSTIDVQSINHLLEKNQQNIAFAKQVVINWSSCEINTDLFNHHLENRIGWYAFNIKNPAIIRQVDMKMPFLKSNFTFAYYKAFLYRQFCLVFSNRQIEILLHLWRKIF